YFLIHHQVFIMSSRFEGLNLAVLEAMASGCVVMGSTAMGVKELIEDNKDGFLFSVGAATELANIIATVLSNPSNYQALATAAREKVLVHYDKKQVTQAYYQLFQNLLTSC
ncbi:glycosyltransferase family 4 protein, partial [Psychrobacter sp.]